MNKSDSIIELAKALSKFQGEVKQPKKGGYNPHFKSHFSTLDDVVKSITETSHKFGLSFMQFPLNDGELVGVKTIVFHESGEFIEGETIYAKPMQNNPQALGSVVSYLKRYSLSAIFGIVADEDDDSNSAMDFNKQNNAPSTPSKPPYKAPSNNTLEVPKTAEEAAKIVFPFGKHVGKTLKEIFISDKSYIKWLVESEKTDPAIFEGIQLMQVAVAQANAAKASQQ